LGIGAIIGGGLGTPVVGALAESAIGMDDFAAGTIETVSNRHDQRGEKAKDGSSRRIRCKAMCSSSCYRAHHSRSPIITGRKSWR
jgi:hypothetical protein